MNYDKDDLVTILRRQTIEGVDLVWAVHKSAIDDLVLRVDAETDGVGRKHCAMLVPSPFDVACLDDPTFRVEYMLPALRVILSHFIGDEKAAAWFREQHEVLRQTVAP